jgi:hypothetical protein
LPSPEVKLAVQVARAASTATAAFIVSRSPRLRHELAHQCRAT